MKNKDQKSLESIYESIRIVKENEDDDLEGGASFEGEGRDLGNIEGVTPDVSSYPSEDEEGEDDSDVETDENGLLTSAGLDALLAKVENGNDIIDSGEAPEPPEDVRADMEEDEDLS
jgi:hypothetical protein